MFGETRPYAIVDTESSGIPNELKNYQSKYWEGFVPRTLSVGAVGMSPGGDIGKSFYRVVRVPESHLKDKRTRRALEINGMSKADILNGDPVEVVAEEFRHYLREEVEARTIWAHNMEFDGWFLSRKPWSLPGRAFRCTMVEGLRLLQEEGAVSKFDTRLSQATLIAYCHAKYGVDAWEGAKPHHALSDAMALARCIAASQSKALAEVLELRNKKPLAGR